jgi:hypothetical protein
MGAWPAFLGKPQIYLASAPAASTKVGTVHIASRISHLASRISGLFSGTDHACLTCLTYLTVLDTPLTALDPYPCCDKLQY